jgi:fatty acid desaturase
MLSELDALFLPLLAFWGVLAGDRWVAILLALAFFFLFFSFFFFGELVRTITSDDKEWLDELESRALSSAFSASWRW